MEENKLQEFQNVIQATNITKKYHGFALQLPNLALPKGFATALIGENGAGKTTLLNILAGIRLDFKGDISYFGKPKGPINSEIQERIGYTGPRSYFLPHWTLSQVEEVNELLFANFHKDRFRNICQELGITQSKVKEIKKLSDGNRMKLMLASVLARDTKLLILDEPASPLDPLMRDKLCDLIRTYLAQGNGERSVFFSTHNISDMENVTDYAIIMDHGRIVEEGFVEDLKEKYILVKGDGEDANAAKEILVSMTGSTYGFEGLCAAENLDRLAGMNVVSEVPTLSQISVGIMKANTNLKLSTPSFTTHREISS
jgi:ABC-2 type transport system ATP-binding protein